VNGLVEEENEDSDGNDDKFDNEEEGGEWVTVENLYKHISGGNTLNLIDNPDNLLFTMK